MEILVDDEIEYTLDEDETAEFKSIINEYKNKQITKKEFKSKMSEFVDRLKESCDYAQTLYGIGRCL